MGQEIDGILTNGNPSTINSQRAITGEGKLLRCRRTKAQQTTTQKPEIRDSFRKMTDQMTGGENRLQKASTFEANRITKQTKLNYDNTQPRLQQTSVDI